MLETYQLREHVQNVRQGNTHDQARASCVCVCVEGGGKGFVIEVVVCFLAVSGSLLAPRCHCILTVCPSSSFFLFDRTVARAVSARRSLSGDCSAHSGA